MSIADGASKRQLTRETVAMTSLLQQRVWVIRGGESGIGEHEQEFLNDGLITVGFGCDRIVTDFKGVMELRRYLEDEREHEGIQAARQLWEFARELRVGDNVILPRTMRGNDRELRIGRVTGDYQFRTDHHHRHWRAARWDDRVATRDGLDRVSLNAVNQRTTLNLIKDKEIARWIRSHCLAV